MRSVLSSIRARVCASLVVGTLAACAQPAEDEPLLGTTAPSNATFRTTRTVHVPIGAWLPPGDERALHVRLSLDAAGARVVFLGRVRAATAPSLRVSLPSAQREVHYEVYAEEGAITRGAWSLPPETRP